MTMAITVTVTQAHIDKGVARECTRCPIALAMIDAGIAEPWVDEVTVCVGAFGVDLPAEAVAFVETFDNGDPVQPFAFELEIPS